MRDNLGFCKHCHTQIAAGDGVFERDRQSGQWRSLHHDCARFVRRARQMALAETVMDDYDLAFRELARR